MLSYALNLLLLSLSIGKIERTRSEKVKYLGLWIDEGLTWRGHRQSCAYEMRAEVVVFSEVKPHWCSDNGEKVMRQEVVQVFLEKFA